MTQTTVGVLRGGPSHEYEVSLKTGAALLNALPEERYRAHDIFIDRDGAWHQQGKQVDPLRILSRLDVVLNGLHGAYGEDGVVQRLLEVSGVPYSGSRPRGANTSINKTRTRKALEDTGIIMPRAVAFTSENPFSSDEMARTVFEQFGPPYVVKPASLGSSIGVTIAGSIIELSRALALALEAYQAVLVEEYIRGREANVGVIEQFRGQEHYALPAVEVHLSDLPFYTYRDKTEGECSGSCPGSFSADEKKLMENMARTVHQKLGLSHYSGSDFIVTARGKIYFLEVDALPGLMEQSLVPKALNTIGSSLPEFAEHLVRLAQKKV